MNRWSLTVMNAYMVYVGDPCNGAELVFAPNARSAKMFAWKHSLWLAELCDDYTALRSNRLRREYAHLFAYADAYKLAVDDPHIGNLEEDYDQMDELTDDQVGHDLGKDGSARGRRARGRSVMKSISFDKESVAAVLEGSKTVTRRLAKEKPCRYRVGETLYVAERWRQPEKDARLFVEVVSVRREPMGDIFRRDGLDLLREGCPNFGFPLSDPAGFVSYNKVALKAWWRDRWNSIHKEPGTRYEDNPDVYRIEFKVVEPTREEQK